MVLRIHNPTFPLNEFVEHLVYYHGLSTAHKLDRFLPDGNTEIIIDLADHSQYIYDNETLEEIQVCRYGWVSGVRTRPITIPSGGGSRMLIVAFKKGRAFPFYSFPISDLTNIVAEAGLVFGRAFCDLREQLLGANSIESMFDLTERFLLHVAGTAIGIDTSNRCVEYALSNIICNPSIQRLHQLSDEIGYSQKHFIDLFRQRVGMTPKQYLRIMRFQKAVLAIERSQMLPWSHIALTCGYYDQAHFIHDFKEFSGFTPGEYMKRKRGTLNYIPVE